MNIPINIFSYEQLNHLNIDLKDQKEIKLIFTKLMQTLSFLYEELELLEFFENVK